MPQGAREAPPLFSWKLRQPRGALMLLLRQLPQNRAPAQPAKRNEHSGAGRSRRLSDGCLQKGAWNHVHSRGRGDVREEPPCSTPLWPIRSSICDNLVDTRSESDAHGRASQSNEASRRRWAITIF